MVVKELFEYPVKGLKGTRTCCASVNSRGLNMDRRWMLVDSENSFLSQRRIPEMARLLPTFKEDLKIENLATSDFVNISLKKFTELEEVVIWGQLVEAQKAENEINSWLSDQLDQEVKLFYMGDENLRTIPERNEGEMVSFADGYPLLLTGTASLDDLNTRLKNPVGIDRFRTNIHVETTKPFEEESWKRIKIGDVTFKLVKKCARCTVINVDQETGKPLIEPLKTLGSYRNEGNKVNFGMNVIPETNGLIHEGDIVEVL